jgi:hypothetical protein
MGPIGNARLTATTGLALLALLAVEGSTILALGPMLPVHVFVGLMLIPPVALKLASTGYRFVRYYARSPSYRARGAPPHALRLIAPVVVASTIVVLASGVALLFAGPGSRGTLLPIHKVSFIVWIAFTSLHVLGHLLETPRELAADYAGAAHADGLGGRGARTITLTTALVAGLVLALLVVGEFGPWLHYHHVPER